MNKALFVDHAFHKKTRSADFFVDILRTRFDVEIYYLTPERRGDEGVLDAAAQADVVILWQMDFLAPLFLSMGKRVIVIPMFDGSGGMPDIHWLFGHRARYINFSLALNERIRMAGGDTMLVRYFPEAVEEDKLPRFDQLNAFFWQRRPDHGLDFRLVDTLLGGEIDSVHVHNVADVPGTYTPKPRSDAPYKYTHSTWFRDKAEFTRCLSRTNVFIAPRVAEGIGMALLEAMAQGKLVLAHDAPTNNEYVSNWINGILFDKDRPSPIGIRNSAAKLAKLGWRTVVEGRKQWLASKPAILRWIEETQPGPAIDMDHAAFYKELWQSYYASHEDYLSFLRRKSSLLSHLSDLSFDKILDVIGDAQTVSTTLQGAIRDCTLDDDGLLDLTREDDRFIGTGWSAAEPDWRWAVGHRSELYFSGVDVIRGKVKASFTASSLPNLGKFVQCMILLNDEVVQEVKITPGWSDYRFSFDADLLRDENQLTLCFDKATTLPSDSRMLSVCFKRFQFSAEY